jgi:murein DD-endopeptidase MepM/ murein hydrolase activator NlpD
MKLFSAPFAACFEPYERSMKYLGKPGRRHAGTRARARLPVVGTTALFFFASAAFIVTQNNSGRLIKNRAQEAPATFELSLPGHHPLAAQAPTAKPHGRLPFEPLVPRRHTAKEPPVSEEVDWAHVEVAPGDNLSLIFSRLKLSTRDLHDIVTLDDKERRLRNLRPGQLLRIRAEGSELLGLVLEMDQLNSLWIERGETGFTLRTETIEPEIRVAEATTAVSHSLFVDGQKAGLSDALIMHLTEIFGWDIDFALDLRENDHFSVIYEEVYKDSEFVKQGRILAAEFVNRGNSHRAVFFTDEQGESAYYSEDGRPMRKAFLRTPVNFTRISSKFNLQRRHPILNTIRAHRGVDYAAPMGTPVRATAKGSIRAAGTSGGYGLVVELQHGKSYSTLYAHLSRVAKGVRRGGSVQQGQVIGYVGKSGLATGPHLHYEFRVDGKHRNPLTIDLPKADPLEGPLLADFHNHAAELFSRLDTLFAKHEKATPGAALLAQLQDLSKPVPDADSTRN